MKTEYVNMRCLKCGNFFNELVINFSLKCPRCGQIHYRKKGEWFIKEEEFWLKRLFRK